VCENCGFEIIGNGYTNHCPHCLWSKHVDINPGDRASNCGGMMEPVTYEKTSDGVSIVHKCQKCRHLKKNKLSNEDDFEKLLKLSGV